MKATTGLCIMVTLNFCAVLFDLKKAEMINITHLVLCVCLHMEQILSFFSQNIQVLLSTNLPNITTLIMWNQRKIDHQLQILHVTLESPQDVTVRGGGEQETLRGIDMAMLRGRKTLWIKTRWHVVIVNLLCTTVNVKYCMLGNNLQPFWIFDIMYMGIFFLKAHRNWMFF